MFYDCFYNNNNNKPKTVLTLEVQIPSEVFVWLFHCLQPSHTGCIFLLGWYFISTFCNAALRDFLPHFDKQEDASCIMFFKSISVALQWGSPAKWIRGIKKKRWLHCLCVFFVGFVVSKKWFQSHISLHQPYNCIIVVVRFGFTLWLPFKEHTRLLFFKTFLNIILNIYIKKEKSKKYVSYYCEYCYL